MILENVPLKSYTSWLVGGPAEFFSEPKTVAELRDTLAWAETKKMKYTVLGGGTNVLISDQGVKGLTICLRKLIGLSITETEIAKKKHLTIECLSGTSKSELLKTFLKYRLEPALFLAGLPGDVGGGIVMNAGVAESFLPREFREITTWIEVLKSSTETKRIDAKNLTWNYRHCDGWKPGVIAKVGLSWPMEPSADLLDRVKKANQVRLSKQPLDQPSCGSVFVNPPGGKSGQLIEQAGLKGFVIGGAKVSEKHANFIVNFANATAKDIQEVIEHVQMTVEKSSGFKLKTEVVYLGFPA